ncbi:MAG: PEFG-CTERM sorting domain-containing protein [Candidatus Nitrosotalea sp.]|nr:PEFG-CTERM sorting domain-containing protein [Candidatus Nitrosotalea sp.]
MIIPFSTGLGFAHAISDQSTTWYGDMTINLSIPQQSIKITSTGTGPFSFTVGNDGAVSGTGTITQNVKVSGIYKGTICNGIGLYVWNYDISGRAYQSTGTANMIFTFISSNVHGSVSCQGGGNTQTIPLDNSPVNTFGPQNIQMNLNQGASIDSPFLGVGDLKIELTGTNSSSLYSIPNQQQSTVQPTLNFSTSIPEFGSLAGMIIAIAIITIIMISRKFRFELKIKN